MDTRHTAGVPRQRGCPRSHPCTAHSGLPPCCAGSSARKRQAAGSAPTARNGVLHKEFLTRHLDASALPLYQKSKQTLRGTTPETAHAANAPIQARSRQLSQCVKSFLIARYRPYNSKTPRCFTAPYEAYPRARQALIRVAVAMARDAFSQKEPLGVPVVTWSTFLRREKKTEI